MRAAAFPEQKAKIVTGLGEDQTISDRAIDLQSINDRFDVILDTVATVSLRLPRRLLHQGGLFFPLKIVLDVLSAALHNPFRHRKYASL